MRLPILAFKTFRLMRFIATTSTTTACSTETRTTNQISGCATVAPQDSVATAVMEVSSDACDFMNSTWVPAEL